MFRIDRGRRDAQLEADHRLREREIPQLYRDLAAQHPAQPVGFDPGQLRIRGHTHPQPLETLPQRDDEPMLEDRGRPCGQPRPVLRRVDPIDRLDLSEQRGRQAVVAWSEPTSDEAPYPDVRLIRTLCVFRRFLGQNRRQLPRGPVGVGHRTRMSENQLAQRVIASYRPRSAGASWARVADAVQELARRADPSTVTHARDFMLIAGAYLVWLDEHGYPTDAESVCNADLFAYWLARTQDGEDRFRRKRAHGALTAVLRGDQPVPEYLAPVLKQRQQPYTVHELTMFRAWAEGQAHEVTWNARALLALGAGAGLFAGELLAVRAGDLVDRGAMTVLVAGAREREVPVLASWVPMLQAVAQHRRADEPLFITSARQRPDMLLREFLSRTQGDHPQTTRLRTTWVCTHLDASTPIASLAAMSGVTEFGAFLRTYLPFSRPAAPAWLAGAEERVA